MQSTGPASHVFMYLCITISYKFHPSFNVQHLFWWGWRCGIRHWGSRLCGVRVIIAPQLCPTDTHLAASSYDDTRERCSRKARGGPHEPTTAPEHADEACDAATPAVGRPSHKGWRSQRKATRYGRRGTHHRNREKVEKQ